MKTTNPTPYAKRQMERRDKNLPTDAARILYHFMRRVLERVPPRRLAKDDHSTLPRAIALRCAREANVLLAVADLGTKKWRTASAVAESARTVLRKEMADELRDARRKLAVLRAEHRTIAREKLRAANLAIVSVSEVKPYPAVPPPRISANVTGAGLPEVSGIYFVYRNGVLVYVGRSTNLRRRARTIGHQNIFEGDDLGWLEFPLNALAYAEAFYIGLLAPARNFTASQRAS